MSKNQILSYVEGLTPVTVMPDFKAGGDTITVKYKIREGNKERIQNFAGVVLQRKGQGPTATLPFVRYRIILGGLNVFSSVVALY